MKRSLERTLSIWRVVMNHEATIGRTLVGRVVVHDELEIGIMMESVATRGVGVHCERRGESVWGFVKLVSVAVNVNVVEICDGMSILIWIDV